MFEVVGMLRAEPAEAAMVAAAVAPHNYNRWLAPVVEQASLYSHNRIAEPAVIVEHSHNRWVAAVALRSHNQRAPLSFSS